MEASRNLLEVVGYLYDAASDANRWEKFLRVACEFFDAPFANFVHLDQQRPELSIYLLSGFEQHSVEDQQAYGAKKQIELKDEDPRMVYSGRHPNKPVRCVDIMPIEEFRKTRVYRELLQPNGIEYSLMVQFSDIPGVFTGISFHRSPEMPVFSEENRDQLGELLPHLKRALNIYQQITLLKRSPGTSYHILDELAAGIVIADEFGNVQFANASAREILDKRDGVAIRAGRLSIGAGSKAFADLLAEVGASGIHRAIPISRSDGRQEYQCLITRLPRQDMQSPPNLLSPGVLAVYLTDPEKPVETDSQLLQRLFGLTPAEARVLERLVAGRTPEQIALDNGVEVSTVRSQIKALYEKTGTSRQLQLMQRVLASPLWSVRSGPNVIPNFEDERPSRNP